MALELRERDQSVGGIQEMTVAVLIVNWNGGALLSQ